MKLQGKTALIAGGGGGIGRAVALALAHEGAKTAVADIVKDNAEKVSGEVKALGVDAIACQVDLTKKADVDRMVNEVLARFGQIDILVNCQGWDRLEPFVESQEETWEKLLAINFKSVLYTAKAVLPQMISHGGGKIVNISSDAGRRRLQLEAVYAGAKGAVIAFSKTIAREVARYKINVNVVCPGLTETPLLQAVRSQSEQYRENYRSGNQGDTVSPSGETRRDCRSCAVLHLSCGGVYHRANAERERRSDDGVNAMSCS